MQSQHITKNPDEEETTQKIHTDEAINKPKTDIPLGAHSASALARRYMAGLYNSDSELVRRSVEVDTKIDSFAPEIRSGLAEIESELLSKASTGSKLSDSFLAMLHDDYSAVMEIYNAKDRTSTQSAYAGGENARSSAVVALSTLITLDALPSSEKNVTVSEYYLDNVSPISFAGMPNAHQPTVSNGPLRPSDPQKTMAKLRVKGFSTSDCDYYNDMIPSMVYLRSGAGPWLSRSTLVTPEVLEIRKSILQLPPDAEHPTEHRHEMSKTSKDLLIDLVSWCTKILGVKPKSFDISQYDWKQWPTDTASNWTRLNGPTRWQANAISHLSSSLSGRTILSTIMDHIQRQTSDVADSMISWFQDGLDVIYSDIKKLAGKVLPSLRAIAADATQKVFEKIPGAVVAIAAAAVKHLLFVDDRSDCTSEIWSKERPSELRVIDDLLTQKVSFISERQYWDMIDSASVEPTSDYSSSYDSWRQESFQSGKVCEDENIRFIPATRRQLDSPCFVRAWIRFLSGPNVQENQSCISYMSSAHVKKHIVFIVIGANIMPKKSLITVGSNLDNNGLCVNLLKWYDTYSVMLSLEEGGGAVHPGTPSDWSLTADGVRQALKLSAAFVSRIVRKPTPAQISIGSTVSQVYCPGMLESVPLDSDSHMVNLSAFSDTVPSRIAFISGCTMPRSTVGMAASSTPWCHMDAYRRVITRKLTYWADKFAQYHAFPLTVSTRNQNEWRCYMRRVADVWVGYSSSLYPLDDRSVPGTASIPSGTSERARRCEMGVNLVWCRPDPLTSQFNRVVSDSITGGAIFEPYRRGVWEKWFPQYIEAETKRSKLSQVCAGNVPRGATSPYGKWSSSGMPCGDTSNQVVSDPYLAGILGENNILEVSIMGREYMTIVQEQNSSSIVLPINFPTSIRGEDLTVRLVTAGKDCSRLGHSVLSGCLPSGIVGKTLTSGPSFDGTESSSFF